eukprot:CAMPEP_0184483940 /NCGR_PEP_ID=MMETSP0113_2-20130426/5622_1 /TAXON_ID=91329 /ORGANISM="Norrisiella sphaerica, Strain BC52" /LENGTH=961 /DNA_ID=CAMNT_0026864629 /DNA_START=144 /DNA_END=3030 /DNA_ORIENTATION=-
MGKTTGIKNQSTNDNLAQDSLCDSSSTIWDIEKEWRREAKDTKFRGVTLEFDDDELEQAIKNAANSIGEENLYQRQIILEKTTAKETLISNFEMIENMMSAGTGAKLKHVVKVMRTWMPKLTSAIKREQNKIRRGEPTIDLSHDIESDSSDLNPYLTNPWARAEEIAYLSLSVFISAALKDRGGVSVASVCNQIGKNIAESVCKTRKKDLAKKRRRERGGRGISGKNNFEYDADPLARPFWPPNVSVRAGILLVQLIIHHAIAPQWWLEEGKRKWEASESGDQWQSTLSLIKGGDDHVLEGRDSLNICSDIEQPSSMQSFSFPMWSPTPSAKAQVVRVFEHTIRYDKEKKKYIGTIRVSPGVRSMIEKVHAIGYAPKHLPMLVKPRPWTKEHSEGYDFYSGGFLTFNFTLLRGGGDMQSNAMRRADLSLLFEGLNAMGETPWRLNKSVYNVVKYIWDNGGGQAGLPPREDLVLPEIPDEARQKNDPEVLELWKKRVAKVEQNNANRHSLRCDLELKLTVMNHFLNDSFYFPYNIDFRGRTYPIPPHFNHLGADVNRGVLLFDKAVPLGPRGMRWLKIHLANLCGNDKVSFDEREEWTDSKLEKVLRVADDPMEHTDFWFEADDPFQALATCFEISKAHRSGSDLDNYKCRLPTHQDGSCNGLQHYAALGRDEHGGASVNLVPSIRPQDVYTEVLKLVLAKLDQDEKDGHELALMLKGLVNRKVVKQTVMTSVYGVTFIGARDQIRARLREKMDMINLDGKDEELDVDKQIDECSHYLAGLTLNSITDLFNCAKNIMVWLSECSSLITSQKLPVCWITPLGLPVVQPYRRDCSYQIETTLQKVTLIDKGDQLPVHNQRHRSAFPPNFVHSLDSTHMLLTAMRCKKEGITYASVHDSYWTHPGKMDRMNEILREEFINLYERPILDDLSDSFKTRFPAVNFPPVPERGTLDLSVVQHSPYFFA